MADSPTTMLFQDLSEGPDSPAQFTFDEMVERMLQVTTLVGVSIGVVRPDASVAFYNVGSAGAGQACDEHTIYQIGSITKAFTGTLLASAVIRGEVTIEEPLEDFLPHECPRWGGDREASITLLNLTTHTSSLPRMPFNMHNRAPINRPTEQYTFEHAGAWLASCELERPIGSNFEYSNIGVGLLGHCLENRIGAAYGDILHERILEPLAMTSTSVVSPPDGLEHRCAQGHNVQRVPKPDWAECPAVGPAGGIYSCTADIVRFIAAALGHQQDLEEMAKAAAATDGCDGDEEGVSAIAEVTAAIEMAMTPLVEVNESKSVGMNWFTRRNDGLVWHNGSTATFTSYMGISPAEGFGVVVLCNQACKGQPKPTGELANKIVRLCRGLPIRTGK